MKYDDLQIMTDDEIQDLIDIFRETILSPVIYIYDEPDRAVIIGFFDTSVEDDYIERTEKRMSDVIGKDAVIEDIRSYDAEERISVIRGADISYAENKRMEEDFLNSIAKDHISALGSRMEIINRFEDTNSFYLQ